VLKTWPIFTLKPDITVINSRRMKWKGHVAPMGEMREAYRILVEKPEGKRPLGRPRRRRKYIKRDTKERWGDCVDWIQVAQDTLYWWAVVNRTMTFFDQLSDYQLLHDTSPQLIMREKDSSGCCSHRRLVFGP
jgi:hypothetical protein